MQPYPWDVTEFYMAPTGRDDWSGRLPEANAAGSDGPLATIPGALRRLRGLSERPMQLATPHVIGGVRGPVVVWMRGGRYAVSEPVTITAAEALPVTFAAFPGETPVLDGGVCIRDWQVGTHRDQAVWTADLPEVRAGRWDFRQLVVNGTPRPRSRWPKRGLLRMAAVPDLRLPASWGNDGQTQFVAAEGDVRAFHNLTDVEVVYLHFWIEERSPIQAFDPATRLVTMARRSRTNLVGCSGSQLADYYLDNVFEALSEPGEWYLDRAAGRLHYLPLPGETPSDCEVVAPRALQLLRLVGTAQRPIEQVRFRGVTFQHTDWRHPGEEPRASLDLLSNPSVASFNRGNDAASAQAAADVPGAIHLEYARHCAFEDCTVRHLGWYGIDLANGCHGIRVVGCDLADLGAGGIKINGTASAEPEAGRTGWNRITDNHIHRAGRVFHSAVGVLSMNAAGNVIAHNHIHDLYYSGISCGWVWGYGPSTSHDNLIEKNHIHDLGQGLLSDMGGVYLLGVQPGTVVRGNVIHDVTKAHYGAWALYTDEGSSHIILENNLCYRTNGHIFHQHYGRENTVRNNIFIQGAEAVTACSRIEPHVSVVFFRNIMVSAGTPIFANDYGAGARRILSDGNLFWDTTRAQPVLSRGGAGRPEADLAAWQARGFDLHSRLADPGFVDPAKDDFRLRPDSPALALGFETLGLHDVGPRPPEQRD
ncbi:MAG: right-handed parallel beta-helix repeat-containing protein [Lentisphaerae bacterium]|nr:right-handed parallel beta-helix repeat-containing protein [Lentisphaerota bacterium]